MAQLSLKLIEILIIEGALNDSLANTKTPDVFRSSIHQILDKIRLAKKAYNNK